MIVPTDEILAQLLLFPFHMPSQLLDVVVEKGYSAPCQSREVVGGILLI